MTRQTTTQKSTRQEGGAQAETFLGEVGFDEWFATPMFEADADERLEELATSRRGPLRLAASAVLRIKARTAQVRAHPELHPRSEEPTLAAPAPLLPADEPSPPARKPRPAAPKPRAVAPKPSQRSRAQRPAILDEPPTVREQRPSRAQRPAIVDEPPTVREQRPSRARQAQTLETRPPIGEQARGEGLRTRVSRTLDRWAEHEIATEARLERWMMPKRWQG